MGPINGSRTKRSKNTCRRWTKAGSTPADAVLLRIPFRKVDLARAVRGVLGGSPSSVKLLAPLLELGVLPPELDTLRIGSV